MVCLSFPLSVLNSGTGAPMKKPPPGWRGLQVGKAMG
jgi:hypothetical protein